MCSITKENFNENYQKIAQAIKKSAFIALDCEFSGLIANESLKNSLFDTSEERYKKLKQNVESFIPIQIGISAFQFDGKKNGYYAHTYTFYIFPKSFGTNDRQYVFQSSAVQFLCGYNFDFNKLFYKGVSYISRKQENELRRRIQDKSFQNQLGEGLQIEVEKVLNKEIESITSWIKNSSENEIYTFENVHFTPELLYIFRKEITKRFQPNILTFLENDQVHIQKVSKDDFSNSKINDSTLENELIDSVVGFAKIYNLLTELKKPIVGHNLYLDLLITYNEFEGELPNTYTEFKKHIHELFPTIYDTKFLSYELKHIVSKDQCWYSNALNDLYKYFKDDQGRHVVFHSPLIELSTGFNFEDASFHDAGWDSYCTGYCFIRMAHIFTGYHYESTSFRPTTSAELLKIVQKYKNCLNVIRGNISHLRLDGPDPVSRRPAWLYITPYRTKNISIEQISNLFGKYGSIDVKMCSSNAVLVAVPNHRCATEILKNFQRYDEFKICEYSALKHSPILRKYLWGGVLVTGAFILIGRKLMSNNS